MKQSIISSQPTFLTNRVTDWQCGDKEHSRPEKENDACSPTQPYVLPLRSQNQNGITVQYNVMKFF